MSRARAVAAVVVAGSIIAIAVPAVAAWTSRVSTSLSASADALAPPSTAWSVTDQSVTVTVLPPGGEPLPSRYEILREDHVVCSALTMPAPCTEERPFASTTTYTVRAGLGQWWTSEAVVAAVVPPAAPGVSLSPDSDTGTAGDGVTTDARPGFVIVAPAGANPYRVTMTTTEGDDVVATTSLDVPTEGATLLTRSADLAPGEYAVRAVATFDGRSSAVTELPLKIVPEPAVTSVVLANGPSSEPGVVDDGDRVIVTVDSPLFPTSVCPTWSGESAWTAGVRARVTRDGDLVLSGRPPVCGQVQLGMLRLPPGVTAAIGSFQRSSLTLDATGTILTLVLGGAPDAGEAIPGGPSTGYTLPPALRSLDGHGFPATTIPTTGSF
jgi:hypothetical protein